MFFGFIFSMYFTKLSNVFLSALISSISLAYLFFSFFICVSSSSIFLSNFSIANFTDLSLIFIFSNVALCSLYFSFSLIILSLFSSNAFIRLLYEFSTFFFKSSFFDFISSFFSSFFILVFSYSLSICSRFLIIFSVSFI